MDHAVIWYLAIGFILVLIGVSSSLVDRVPLTTSMIYLALGLLLGRQGLQIVHFNLIEDASLFERLTELVVIVSLFCAGLKLRLPFRDRRWIAPLRLAFGSMAVTVGLIALFAVYVLKLPWGVGILLGGILAPTDPVLASDVQVKNSGDQDQLRFGLTAEAGLNDGSAFPFVLLGLGLMGLYDLGGGGWHWFVHDWLWATVAGLALGAVLGQGVSAAVLELRKRNKETVVLDDFLALGVIALAYGGAIMIGAYGFLSVFAAGLAMRKVAKGKPGVLSFTEQMERLGEVFTVVFLGTMLNFEYFWSHDLWVVPVLLLGIRPLSVFLGLIGTEVSRQQRAMISWFGIRGIGSLYYLTYALGRGIEAQTAERIAAITFATIIISIIVHGISALPFMNLYDDKLKNR